MLNSPVTRLRLPLCRSAAEDAHRTAGGDAGTTKSCFGFQGGRPRGRLNRFDEADFIKTLSAWYIFSSHPISSRRARRPPDSRRDACARYCTSCDNVVWLVAKLAEPAKVAVMLWAPVVSNDVLICACPLTRGVEISTSAVLDSQLARWSGGRGEVTTAVSVTVWPEGAGLSEDASVVFVATGSTICGTLPLLVAYMLLPLKPR